MSANDVLDYTTKMMFLVLILSMPSIVAATVVSTLISFIQALTQVQEQTLGYAAKLVVVILTLYLTSGWLGRELFSYTNKIFDQIPKITE